MRKFHLWTLVAALLTLATSSASAQRRLSGVVTAVGGGPLGNTSVSVQGTTTGIYTGEDGRFALTVKDGPLTLVVRRIGYRRALVPVTATQNDVAIQLEHDVLELEHVVVTGTATSVSSVNAANAVATVTADQLNRAPTPTLENALQGKIPGAVITTNSGAPGGGSQVQLRGSTSINANASPLYVIDGVLVSNAEIANGLNSITNAGGGINSAQDQPVNRIADINPADIETIEVLKGASAGAIYGSKASAGVIIITTKRGTSGKPRLNVTQRVGQFSLAKKLGHRCFKTVAEAMAWEQVDTPEELTAPFTGKCNDFEQQYYSGNAPSYETDLSLNGGSAQGTTYYIAGLAKRDNAIARSTYYQKQSLTANIGQTVGSRLTLRTNNQFVHSLTDRGISGNDNSPITSPGDVFSGTPSYFDLSSGARNPYLSSGTNPFQTASKLKAPEDVFRYIGSVNGSLNVFASPRQTLDLSVIAGVDALNFNGRIISPADLYFEPADGLPGTVTTNNTTSVQANINASGIHKWTLDHLTATTSFGLRNERRQNDQILNLAQNVPAGAENIRLGGQVSINESKSLVKDLGYFAQEELLALDDRLLLTAAINAERSSVNGDDRKLYSYPKFAASYRLPWLPSVFDEFKVRAAYGKAGNQPPYGFKFTALTINVYDGNLAGRPSTVGGDANIRPETSIETEGGFDAQMFNGRLAFEATYFNKRVEDLILQAAVAPTSGFTTRFLNGGSMVNKGTELGLTATPVDYEGFRWISRTTFAQVRGRVTSLDVPAFSPNVGGFAPSFGIAWIEKGFSPTTVQVFDGCDAALNDAGRCPSGHRVLRNYESAPDYTMGFSNELRYKGLSLYGLVDWRKGGRVVNITNIYYDASGLGPDPKAAEARNSAAAAGKAAYLENGGFVKLRELNLSYTVPGTFTQRWFSAAKDLRLELSGRNLLTSTKYTGYDPEVSNFSNQNVGRFQDVTPYPPSRSFFFSVSATF